MQLQQEEQIEVHWPAASLFCHVQVWTAHGDAWAPVVLLEELAPSDGPSVRRALPTLAHYVRSRITSRHDPLWIEQSRALTLRALLVEGHSLARRARPGRLLSPTDDGVAVQPLTATQITALLQR